jgi:uncharacterized damage-inducible protein DinB
VTARRKAALPSVPYLLRMLDEAYDHHAWHGTNLKGSLRRVTAAQAIRRPAPGRHSVWELALHAAYWKYAVLRRLTGAKRGSFPVKGSNWFSPPKAASEKAWREVLGLLDETHGRLREAVARMPAAALGRRSKGSRYTPAEQIAGIAFHDVYHAGQIQLVKRFLKGAR